MAAEPTEANQNLPVIKQGVVGLAFRESPESPLVADEKHLVLSVWHPGEEMNLSL